MTDISFYKFVPESQYANYAGPYAYAISKPMLCGDNAEDASNTIVYLDTVSGRWTEYVSGNETSSSDNIDDVFDDIASKCGANSWSVEQSEVNAFSGNNRKKQMLSSKKEVYNKIMVDKTNRRADRTVNLSPFADSESFDDDTAVSPDSQEGSQALSRSFDSAIDDELNALSSKIDALVEAIKTIGLIRKIDDTVDTVNDSISQDTEDSYDDSDKHFENEFDEHFKNEPDENSYEDKDSHDIDKQYDDKADNSDENQEMPEKPSIKKEGNMKQKRTVAADEATPIEATPIDKIVDGVTDQSPMFDKAQDEATDETTKPNSANVGDNYSGSTETVSDTNDLKPVEMPTEYASTATAMRLADTYIKAGVIAEADRYKAIERLSKLTASAARNQLVALELAQEANDADEDKAKDKHKAPGAKKSVSDEGRCYSSKHRMAARRMAARRMAARRMAARRMAARRANASRVTSHSVNTWNVFSKNGANIGEIQYVEDDAAPTYSYDVTVGTFAFHNEGFASLDDAVRDIQDKLGYVVTTSKDTGRNIVASRRRRALRNISRTAKAKRTIAANDTDANDTDNTNDTPVYDLSGEEAGTISFDEETNQYSYDVSGKQADGFATEGEALDAAKDATGNDNLVSNSAVAAARKASAKRAAAIKRRKAMKAKRAAAMRSANKTVSMKRKAAMRAKRAAAMRSANKTVSMKRKAAMRAKRAAAFRSANKTVASFKNAHNVRTAKITMPVNSSNSTEFSLL